MFQLVTTERNIIWGQCDTRSVQEVGLHCGGRVPNIQAQVPLILSCKIKKTSGKITTDCDVIMTLCSVNATVTIDAF
jgi:hypothetical protein